MAQRERYFVDKEVQGTLVWRVVAYWTAGVAYVALGSIGSNFYQSPDWSLSQHFNHLLDTYWAWIPSAIIILPLLVYDAIRLSNRFAGPIYHLRVHLPRLLQSTTKEGIRFRNDDYWRDLAEPINQLQNRILGLQKQVVDLQSQLAEARLVASLLPTGKSKTKHSQTPVPNEQNVASNERKNPGPLSDTDTTARTQSGTALLSETLTETDTLHETNA